MTQPTPSDDRFDSLMETVPADAFPLGDSVALTRNTPVTTSSGPEHRNPEPPRLSERVAKEFDELHGTRFHIHEHLGSGGSGEVYRCFDQHLQRHIAVKSLGRQRLTQNRQARLIQEARITARLEHPNILPIHDLAFAGDGSPYYSMREAAGHSLLELIDQRRQGQTPAAIAEVDAQLDIMLHVCDACGHAHSRGIIHQDIKPANIMVGDFGEVVLLDWGTAIDLNQADERMRLMGTPAYMSPEQSRSEHSDQRSDIYCICASFYHLLTGELLVQQMDLDSFWHRRRNGIIDPLPEALRQRLPPGLLEVILVGLEPDPLRRYQDIPALQQALRSWRRHRDALQLEEQAVALMQLAVETPSHQHFLRCRQRLEQSLAIWPDNRGAHSKLQDVLQRHCDFAVQQGDLDMARQLLQELAEPPSMLSARITQLERERQNLRRRARWSRIAMAGCLVLAGLLALLLLDQQRRRQDAWILVHDMQPQDWRHATLAGPYGQRPLPPHQRPDAEHLYIDNEDVISLPEWDSSGEVRISCEISWPGHVSAFDIIARAQLAQSYHTKHAPAGLLARVGGPDRLCLLDLRAEPYQPHGRWSARMHLLPDVRHHIELEILQHRLRLSVDGTILIDELMLIPELAADWGGLALRSHGPCQVHSLRLQRRQLAESSGPLTVADGLLGNGDLRAAYDSYRHIASRYTGTIRERALARGIGVGARIDFDDVTTLQRLQTRLHREFPHSRWLQEADEAICLAYWRHGHHTEALARADALLQRWPASDVAVSITSLPHQPLLPAIAEDLMGIIGRSPSIHQLDLSHYQLRDISDLAAHRLVSLQLSGNQITDLAPLHGQPLHELGLNGNPVQDLSPMRGAPLARLMATNTPLKSLAPLADCPQLRYLDCSDAAVQDLTPLRALQRLRILKLRRTAISDLEPLTALPLVELRLDGCAISDLSAVAGMPLEHLSISDCPVTDLGPLARLPLRRLAMDRCPVADLAELPLQGLQRFSGRDLRLPDLAALSAAPLHVLTLDGNRIDDPSRLLAALPQLQQLSLRRCRLPTQLELPAAHLHLLDLAETGMQHLRLHPDSRIESLDLSGNGPLAVHLPEQLGLHELLLDGTMLERALLPTELPELRVLQIDQHSMTQAQAGQLHRLLLQGEHHPDLLASLRLSMSLAWPNGDYPAQALYQHHTGLYLDTGRVLDQTAAETLAARLHAHLPAAGLPPGLLRALVLPNTRIMAGGGLLHDTNHAGYLRPAAPWEGGRTILFWPASATAP